MEFTRRQLIAAAGAGAVVGAGAAVAVPAAVAASTSEPSPGLRYDFYGQHQAGIVTPAQDRLHFVAFDVTSRQVADVERMLREWTLAAARMTQGLDAGPTGATGGAYDGPPDDTGEAQGLPAAGLTLTFGFGPSFFRRFDLPRPPALVELPHFPGDDLDPALSNGDICIQACANDPQVAVHAIRNLARIAFGTAAVRWSQLGFGRTSSTSATQDTPRNLFGFKDGTSNVKSEETAEVDNHVWTSQGPEWMHGGSYLVARRIRMTIETWDRTSLREQEAIIGRTKGTGAPLSGGTEFTPPDFTVTGSDNQPLVPVDSHVRVAHPDSNGGIKILRRGYNFVDGSDSLGRLNAGLFFLAYQNDPRTAFIPLQKNLARNDAMNEYVKHVGSGLWAVPRGVANSDEYLGQGIFG